MSRPKKDEVLSNPLYHWQQASTTHFDIYYVSGLIPQDYVDQAGIIFEKKSMELLASLEIPKYDHRISLFMIDSREKMKSLVGLETNGLANVEDHTIFSVFNEKIKTLGIHEVCHILTTNMWGKTREVWLNEGLAVCSDGVWWGYDLHSLAFHLQTRGKLVPVKELIDHFPKHPSIISYPECGSLVRFIKGIYGLAVIKDLWKNGTTAFDRSLNKSLSTIEQEWLGEIQQYRDPSIDYESKVSAATKNKPAASPSPGKANNHQP